MGAFMPPGCAREVSCATRIDGDCVGGSPPIAAGVVDAIGNLNAGGWVCLRVLYGNNVSQSHVVLIQRCWQNSDRQPSRPGYSVRTQPFLAEQQRIARCHRCTIARRTGTSLPPCPASGGSTGQSCLNTTCHRRFDPPAPCRQPHNPAACRRCHYFPASRGTSPCCRDYCKQMSERQGYASPLHACFERQHSVPKTAAAETANRGLPRRCGPGRSRGVAANYRSIAEGIHLAAVQGVSHQAAGFTPFRLRNV